LRYNFQWIKESQNYYEKADFAFVLSIFSHN